MRQLLVSNKCAICKAELPRVICIEDETKEKFSLAGAATFPTVSIINPELQATVTNDYLAYEEPKAGIYIAYSLRRQ